MKTIKVGVIGVGYLGRFHALKYAAMDSVELIGVVDVDQERTARIAGECSTAAFNNYHELLDKVDAVSIVVPTLFHHEVAMEAISHKVNLLVEKPFTTTLAEADELIRLAQEKDLVLQVGHLERFNPAVLAMRPLLHNPLFIEAHRISVFKDRGTDVDVVLDLMIHDIDIILSIVDSPLESIHTVGAPVITPLTDIANARLIFANGCAANITVSRISMDNIRRMRIFQPGRYLSVDFSKKEVMSIRLKRGEMNKHPLPDISKFAFPDRDSLEMELLDFMENVRSGTRPEVSGHEGRKALAVALDVVEQIRKNRERIKDMLGTDINFSGLNLV